MNFAPLTSAVIHILLLFSVQHPPHFLCFFVYICLSVAFEKLVAQKSGKRKQKETGMTSALRPYKTKEKPGCSLKS
uniref:Uncharacterized protein n=1 Tax=Caenorhabditis japonica TaxID=281687 RepID=A0A8R1E9H0_CAEJA